ELRHDRLDGASEVAQRRAQVELVRRLDGERHAQVDRRREREPAGEIGELADQVDAPRREEAADHPPAAPASASSSSSSACHGWKVTVSRSIRWPSIDSTLKRSPSCCTSSPGAAARPSSPKTKPASVW